MKPLIAPQELARRNNEAAAVQRAYEELCRKRRRSRLKSPLAKKVLDALDRQEAESVARPTRAVGFFAPKKPAG